VTREECGSKEASYNIKENGYSKKKKSIAKTTAQPGVSADYSGSPFSPQVANF
jgi:hypothetical protein